MIKLNGYFGYPPMKLSRCDVTLALRFDERGALILSFVGITDEQENHTQQFLVFLGQYFLHVDIH